MLQMDDDATNSPTTVRSLTGQRVRAEAFILCDGVQVHDGKLFILGGGWDRLLVRAFPVEQTFALAIKLSVPASEAYRPMAMTLEVRDEEGTIAGGQVHSSMIEVSRPLGYAPHEDVPCFFPLHVGLVVRKPERLTFVLLIDGDPIARTSIASLHTPTRANVHPVEHRRKERMKRLRTRVSSSHPQSTWLRSPDVHFLGFIGR